MFKLRYIYDPSVRPQTVFVSTNMEKHEREIGEVESQRRNHRASNLGDILGAFGKHLRSISEASEKHLGDIWETFGET